MKLKHSCICPIPHKIREYGLFKWTNACPNELIEGAICDTCILNCKQERPEINREYLEKKYGKPKTAIDFINARKNRFVEDTELEEAKAEYQNDSYMGSI